ncbi:MAG: hypothetical protein WD096_05005 [Actinomycetota bacterium]
MVVPPGPADVAPERLTRLATTFAVVLAGSAVLGVAAWLVLDNRWGSPMCSGGQDRVYKGVVILTLACSILAVITGIAALTHHTERRGIVLMAMGGAVISAAAILFLLGEQPCGVIAT